MEKETEVQKLTPEELKEIEEETRKQAFSVNESRLNRVVKFRIAYLKKQAEGAGPEKIKKIHRELQDIEQNLAKKHGVEARAERTKPTLEIEVSGFSAEIERLLTKPEVSGLLDEISAAEKQGDDALAEQKGKALDAEIENAPWLDDEDFASYIKNLVPGFFHKFVEKNCKFIYDPTQEESTMVPPAVQGEKLVFTIGKGALYKKTGITVGGKEISVIKPAGIAYQIGRMLGNLLIEPQNWKELKTATWQKEKKNLPDFEEYVALCLTDPPTARELYEPAFKECTASLYNLGKEDKDIDLTKIKEKKFDSNTDIDYGKDPGAFKRAIRFMGNLRRGLRETISALYQEKRIWYDIALAQLELEEAKLITTRQEHISDRDKRLYLYLTTGDRPGARGLILSAASTGDSRWWRYQLYLAYFDSEYQATNGEYITRLSYDFLVRCTRTSHQMKRSGTKPGEYSMVIENGVTKYKRLSSKEWDERVVGEVNKLSGRQILNTADECFDWMRIPDGRIMEPDEIFGGDTPLAFREGFSRTEGHIWENEKWLFETNDFHSNQIKIPEYLTRRAFTNTKKPCYKLDPDQLAVIAKILAAAELSEQGSHTKDKKGIGDYVRHPFIGAEHARGIQRDIVGFYQLRIREYNEWKESKGKTNEAFEQLIKMVDIFKRSEISSVAKKIYEGGDKNDVAILRGLKIPENEEETLEANKTTREEPDILLKRDGRSTAKKYSEVEKVKNDSEKDFSDRLDKMGPKIPDKLKEWLKKDPSRILDILTYPEITSAEVAREILEQNERTILNMGDATYQEDYEKLSQKIEKDAVPLLQKYFDENQAKIIALIKTADWIDHNDLKPFLSNISEGKEGYKTLESEAETELAKGWDDKVGAIEKLLADQKTDEARELFKETFPDYGKSRKEGGLGIKDNDLTENKLIACANSLSKSEQEKEKGGIRQKVLDAENEKIREVLTIFRGKIPQKIDDVTGFKIAELDDDEKNLLAEGVKKLRLLPEILKDEGKAGKAISFYSLPEGNERTYFTLKALEASILAELAKIKKPSAGGAPEEIGEEPVEFEVEEPQEDTD